MTFIRTYAFKAQISTPGLLGFIARTPPEYYYLLVTPDKTVYGVFLSDDVLEYFTNEFVPHHLEIISLQQLQRLSATPGAKAWGNAGLLQP